MILLHITLLEVPS